MESEEQAQTNGVDEATRLAASARTFTLDPISENIIPDEEPDDLIVAHHILSPPIANIPSDEERTPSQAVQSAVAQKNHRRALSVSIFVVTLLTCATTYLILTK